MKDFGGISLLIHPDERARDQRVATIDALGQPLELDHR